MISLKEKIASDMKEAMKKGEKKRVATLRLILADIKNEEVSGSEKRELSDEEIVAVLRRAVKKRKEAIEQFKMGSRYDMAEEEEEEIRYIQDYLPPSLSADEVKRIVREVIGEVHATGPKDMGKVMKLVMSRVAGRADGKLVSGIVKEMLRGAPE